MTQKTQSEYATKERAEAILDQIIRMAWADDVSFEKIKKECGTTEADVIKIMRNNLKANSFKLWRKRVSGRLTKHEKRNKLIRQEIEQL